MIKSMTVTNYLGESLKIVLADDEPASGLLITKIDGLGPAKATINKTDLATTDGSLFNSSKLTERNIVITFLLERSFPEPTDNLEQTHNIENTRQRTYKYFPSKRQVTLSFETDNRNARVVGWVESNEPDIFSKDESQVISIICPDPYFYSNERGYSPHVVEFSGLSDEFEFPFSNESLEDKLLVFGNISPVVTKSFAYYGDQETGIKMILHFVNNVNTNIRIDKRKPSDPNEIMSSFLLDVEKFTALMETGFLNGDSIVVDTTMGNKRITLERNGLRYNILNAVSRDSDWFQLDKGTNTFYMTAFGNEQSLTFRIENYVLYEGI